MSYSQFRERLRKSGHTIAIYRKLVPLEPVNFTHLSEDVGSPVPDPENERSVAA